MATFYAAAGRRRFRGSEHSVSSLVAGGKRQNARRELVNREIQSLAADGRSKSRTLQLAETVRAVDTRVFLDTNGNAPPRKPPERSDIFSSRAIAPTTRCVSRG